MVSLCTTSAAVFVLVLLQTERSRGCRTGDSLLCKVPRREEEEGWQPANRRTIRNRTRLPFTGLPRAAPGPKGAASYKGSGSSAALWISLVPCPNHRLLISMRLSHAVSHSFALGPSIGLVKCYTLLRGPPNQAWSPKLEARSAGKFHRGVMNRESLTFRGRGCGANGCCHVTGNAMWYNLEFASHPLILAPMDIHGCCVWACL